MKYLALTFFILFLNGCSLTTTVPATTQYHIAMPQVVAMNTSACQKKTVKISLIQSPSIFKFTQMFYADANLRQFAYTQSAWSESPAERLQTIYLTALSQSNLFKSVIGYQSLAAYDYLVEIHLYDFMQYFDDAGHASVRMSFDLVMIEHGDRKVMGTFHFNEILQSESADAIGGVSGLNDLVNKSVETMLIWVQDECAKR